jgi:hypothetical protein
MINKIFKVSSIMTAAMIMVLVATAFNQTGSVSAAALSRQNYASGQAGYGQAAGSQTGYRVGPGSQTGYQQGAGISSTRSRVALTPLSKAEKDTLNQALLEEYGALNLYQSVIGQFGSVAVFAQIARAEQQHINALTRLMTKYQLAVPVNPGLNPAPTFATLSEACQAGVTAEIADAALYDELMPEVSHTDILRVFSNLQNASLNNHLPAFEACQ